MIRLKELREAKHMSQQAVADVFHVTQQTIFKYEHALAEPYLDKMNEELEKLGQIAALPDSVHDILHISPAFLVKYGIDKNASATERSCQAEKAYRELDARFMKMTGREPYANELFASLRQGKEKTPEAKRPKQVHKPILRNPPSKGRKMGL